MSASDIGSIAIATAKRNAEYFSASISMVETAIAATARGCLVSPDNRAFIVAEAAVGDLIVRMGSVQAVSRLLGEVLGRYEDMQRD